MALFFCKKLNFGRIIDQEMGGIFQVDCYFDFVIVSAATTLHDKSIL